MIKLSTDQKVSIEMGRRARRRLIKECRKIVNRVNSDELKSYLDSIIAGESGVGKSFNIEKILDECNIPHVKLTGNASIFGLMGHLMMLHASKPKGQRVVVFLDDVDFLFDPKNINIFKHMCATNAKDRKFEYLKAINKGNFTEPQQDLLELYAHPMSQGLVIPCDEFIFIVASNRTLADEQSVKSMTESQQVKAAHELAIRGRTRYYDFILNKQEKWGWLYEVAINDGGLDILTNEQDKLYLLDWIWNNWDNMKETSVRTIQKMAQEIIEDPEEYKDNWELDYLVA